MICTTYAYGSTDEWAIGMKNTSYFSLDNRLNPLNVIERWLNPYKHIEMLMLDGQQINIALTDRAQQALHQRSQPLVVEMQLYFSCMVKKRTIFHTGTDAPTSTPINQHLGIAFRCVQSESCDPEEFAAHYPGKKTLVTTSAIKMHPRELYIDHKNDQWTGEFSV